MKYIKTFEDNNVNQGLLCVKEPHKDYYWKYTSGKKYKIYYSSVGKRIKDDNGKFDTNTVTSILYNNEKECEYAGSIFTTDNSIEDYELRKKSEKFNL